MSKEEEHTKIEKGFPPPKQPEIPLKEAEGFPPPPPPPPPEQPPDKES